MDNPSRQRVEALMDRFPPPLHPTFWPRRNGE